MKSTQPFSEYKCNKSTSNIPQELHQISTMYVPRHIKNVLKYINRKNNKWVRLIFRASVRISSRKHTGLSKHNTSNVGEISRTTRRNEIHVRQSKREMRPNRHRTVASGIFSENGGNADIFSRTFTLKCLTTNNGHGSETSADPKGQLHLAN